MGTKLTTLKGPEPFTVARVRCLINHYFRILFSVDDFERCGFFLENHLSKMVHVMVGAMYPDGTHSFLVGQPITAVCVSNDGRRVLIGDNEKKITEIDLERCQKIRHDWHSSHFQHLSDLSEHSGKLLTSAGERVFHMWQINNRTLLRTFKGHTRYVMQARFSYNGEYIVSSSADHTIRVWDIDTGDCKTILMGHPSRVDSIVLGRTKTATMSSEGSVAIWDNQQLCSKKPLLGFFEEHEKSLKISMNTDESLIAVSLESGISVREIPSFNRIWYQSFNYARATFQPYTYSVLAVVGDSTLRICDALKPEEFEMVGRTQANSAIFTLDGTRILDFDDNARMTPVDRSLRFVVSS